MWLVTDIGFFSIVEKPGDAEAGTLTVRARVRADLERLRDLYLPELGPISESGVNDYCFRARAPRADVAAAMSKAVESIQYSNFKSRVRQTQGPKRESLLHDVWHVLYRLQRP